MESARNLFLLHLNKNQKSNGFLLQVCQTDAVPAKAHWITHQCYPLPTAQALPVLSAGTPVPPILLPHSWSHTTAEDKHPSLKKQLSQHSA